MNLAELREAVARKTGRDAASRSVTQFLNEALMRFDSRDWPWQEREAVFVGDGTTCEFQMPYAVKVVQLVTVGQHELPKVADTIDVRTDVVGWSMRSRELVVRPAPGQVETLVVKYRARESGLEDDDDEPMAPEEYHWPLVDFACSILSQAAGDQEMADRWRKNYEDGVKEVHGAEHTSARRRITITAL